MENIVDRLDEFQDQIDELLGLVSDDKTSGLAEILPTISEMVTSLLTLYSQAHNKEIKAETDLLLVFKAFVKGDPSLNAVRDNVREIVYYQNCLAENREDALPSNPERMAVRTVQHIYFYLRSRLEQEELLD